MMADETTTRLALPLLAAGQAQKEITHNEALAALDLAVQASVVEVGRNDPPDGPVLGQAWIVGAVPSGAWSGRADAVAGWTPGGWRFVLPFEGMMAWSASDALVARYTSGAWSKGVVRARSVVIDGEQVVGARQAAIALPNGGSVIDAEARGTVQAMLACLRQHGLIAT